MEKHTVKSWGSLLVLVAFLFGMAACGTQAESTGTDGTDGTSKETIATPKTLFLSLSQRFVKWDNSDGAEVVATVLDGNHVVIKGAVVSFSADGGQLSPLTEAQMPSSVTTDSYGIAKVKFSSGAVPPGSQTITITARAGGLRQSITIQTVDPESDEVQPEGSQPRYLSLSLSQPAVKRDNTDRAVIIATVVDGSQVAVKDAVVAFSADAGLLLVAEGFTQTQSGILTDASGQAKMEFLSGAIESGRTVTIRVRVVGAPYWYYVQIPESLIQSIPLQVVEPEAADTSPEALQPTFLSLASSKPSVAWGDEAGAEITAIVLDRNRNAVKDAVVSFSTDRGLLSAMEGYTQTTSGIVTDANGMAKMMFSSGNDRTGEPAWIKAQVVGAPYWFYITTPDYLVKTVKVQITSSELMQPADLSITLSKTFVEWGNKDSAEVTVTVVDGNRIACPGAVVLFNASAGQLTPASGYVQTENGIVADVNGVAKMIFTSGTITVAQDVAITVYVTGAPYWYYNVTPDYLTKRATIQVVQPTMTEESDRPELQPASLSLSLSRPQVKTDNSDYTIIYAVVKDSNNLGVKDAVITFSADGGQLYPDAASRQDPYGGFLTDSTGTAIIRFSSGTTDLSNRTITVEARVVGAPYWYYFGVPAALVRIIPVEVTGTTVALSASRTVLTIGGNDTANVTATVVDAGGKPIYNAAVGVRVAAGATGAVAVSLISGTTDTMGRVSFTVRGTSPGDVTVQASALNAVGNQAFTVANLVAAFAIIDPAQNTLTRETNTPLSVTVQSPSPGPSNSVIFTTTLGFWVGSGANTETVVVAGGQAVAQLNSTVSGVATVEVYDADNPAMKDSMTVAFSAPAANAAQIDLQASATTLAPNVTGSTTNSITLYATVRTAAPDNQVVGGAAVQFYILNPTGGGEYISPVVVLTNSQGLAQTKLTSGTLSSGADGIRIVAKIVDSLPEITDEVRIIIGGTAVSLSIGVANVVEASEPTTYKAPCSVLLSDSAGNPIANANVTLKLWPTYYKCGVWADSTPFYHSYTINAANEIKYREALFMSSICRPADPCYVPPTAPDPAYTDVVYLYRNEDVNRNLLLDVDPITFDGEDGYFDAAGNLELFNYTQNVELFDATGMYLRTESLFVPGHGDGMLTPSLSDAGTVPSIVTTDENGIAYFYHIYQRNYGIWLEVEISATTVVYGTETSSTHKRWLEILVADKPYHKDSPYNY